jgi:hypothetical protein
MKTFLQYLFLFTVTFFYNFFFASAQVVPAARGQHKTVDRDNNTFMNPIFSGDYPDPPRTLLRRSAARKKIRTIYSSYQGYYFAPAFIRVSGMEL